MSVNYKKEFFDREYSLKDAYSRVWIYARQYKFRICFGIVCGMLTAGTLLPLFQVIQPAMQKVSGVEQAVGEVAPVEAAPAKLESADVAVEPVKKKSRLERQMDNAAKLPSWYPKVEKLAAKCGITLQDKEGNMGGAMLFIALVVIPLVALVRLALVFLNQYCLTWAASHAVADLRCDLMAHIQRQSMQFHGRIDVGQIIARATGDPQALQLIIQTMLSELARAPFEILVSVGFIIWFAISNNMLPTLAVIVIGMPAFMVPVMLLAKVIRKWTKRTLESGSVVTSRSHEILTCVKVVKAYDTEKLEADKYRQVNSNLLKNTLRAVRTGLLVGPAVEAMGVILICGVIVWCFIAHVTLANLLPMIAPLLLIYKPLKQLGNLQVQIEVGSAALCRMWSLLDVHMEIPERSDPVRKRDFSDKVVFEDVSFKYDTGETDAVSHASFEIGKGMVVAVVGGTGSGKSTMSGLLSRFFDPREGRVMIDGVDIRDLKISDLHDMIGSVMQETLLFNDTIEENIRYGTPGATREQVIAAAKQANAHEFIMSQPSGYDRVVGEKGFALSGGERQRIAIARAILKNPPILILDEATSALDTVTEKIVQAAIANLMDNRTTFAIAHRLSTIRNADLILVMDHGKIVERGTHEELYAMNGFYRRLCDMQKAQ